MSELIKEVRDDGLIKGGSRVGIAPISIYDFLDTRTVKCLYHWLNELSPRGKWHLGQQLTIDRDHRTIVAVVCHTNGCWKNSPEIVRKLINDLRHQEIILPAAPIDVLIPAEVYCEGVFNHLKQCFIETQQPTHIYRR